MNDLLMNVLVWLSTVLILSCSVVYLFFKKRYRYWKDLGVPGPEPEMFYGNIRPLIQVKVNNAELNHKFYQDFSNEDYIGYYNLWNPVLFIRDLDLARRILERDFDHFYDRMRFDIRAKTDSVLISLFTFAGEPWKSRRAVFNKLFTPKKIKEYLEDIQVNMPYLLKDIEDRLDEDCELGQIMRKHAVRAICMELYGLDVSKDEERIKQFTESAKLFTNPPISVVVRALLAMFAPRFFRFFRIPIFPKHLYDFFSNLLNEMMSARVNSHCNRSDLLDTLMKMMDDGTMDKGKITFDEAVGHVYIFFQASFDTTDLTTCHAILQLALHPDVQEKARQEVDSILAGSRVITYEHIAQMNYMEAIVYETLRKFPPVAAHDRICTKPYKVDQKLTIPVGATVLIPAASIHKDPNYYQEPEKFMPERFYNKEESNKDAWMPFGAGPRMCIGMRLAKQGIKLVLATILLDYVILPSDKMELPIKFDPKTLAFSVQPINGFWVRMKKR